MDAVDVDRLIDEAFPKGHSFTTKKAIRQRARQAVVDALEGAQKSLAALRDDLHAKQDRFAALAAAMGSYFAWQENVENPSDLTELKGLYKAMRDAYREWCGK